MVVAIDAVVEGARCGCRNGAEMYLQWYIFCSVSSLDNGTEGGVAKHPFNLKRSVRINLLGSRTIQTRP